jgi:ATP-binding cassette subfamily B protein
VVTTVLGLSTSLYVQKIVDTVIPDGNRPLLNLLALAMLVILAFKTVLGLFQSVLSLRTAQRIDAALILAYYQHLLGLPQTFFDTMRIGEITSRVGDAVKIRNFLNGALLNLLLNPLILVFSLGALFFYSPRLALLSLALVPANALIYLVVNHLNRSWQRGIMERSADFESHLVESLGAQTLIRQFQLAARQTFESENRLVRLLRTTWRAAVGAVGCGSAATIFTSAYSIVLLWLGAGLVLESGLSPGELMSCYTLSGYLTGPIAALIGLNGTIQETFIAVDRLFEIMDLELESDRGLLEFTRAHAGEIRVDQVAFRHAGRSTTLAGIDLVLPAGKLSVLTGESGCGKSTLLCLLQRFYQPESGRILIGGHDIRHFRLGSLRRHLGVVPQQIHLLSGTVIENLAPTDPHPDVDRLLGLCRQVGILEFIERLPHGFLTGLSENGANLSGGQRQRLALVRALYSDAPILLLDEPSSALDAQAETALLHLLRELRDRGRTIVVAAHSPRLLAVADVIVTLAAGRVVSSVAVDAAPADAPVRSGWTAAECGAG